MHALHPLSVETYMLHQNRVQGIQFSVLQAETRLASDLLDPICYHLNYPEFAPSALSHMAIAWICVGLTKNMPVRLGCRFCRPHAAPCAIAPT